MAENTPAGRNIGAPVAANDAGDDLLTYSLSGDGAASFDIVRSSGQIRTKSALDFETDPVVHGDGDGNRSVWTLLTRRR